MSKFKVREAEERRKKRKGYSLQVEREGAGQVAVVGSPNVGKSKLLASLTNASPEVVQYPFTTHQPLTGMK
ncbi:50S ribosome-binding GTPase [bacterium]|nr:50S ribosome-binding GTPase [bacterium]